ncbi:breast cancer metastasis-suppressor 1-like protein [Diabrotica virgifera virgifera]|uniref:Breast cancer metastasis-suppressor 1-like protein n=1 Tax=Diabrotica virgifera virgifera TaxID=50390 RepID=A0A6P7F7J3_DIAVI|nr:breast cancer metastasis-suppressor 1-like protein [Diabrotica virgifera virgifera]
MPPIKLSTSNSGVNDLSDNEVSGNESQHSNSSRENDVAHDSTEDEPDSDDSSEMDEGECETRRNALLQHVQDLEKQFCHLREQLFRERMTQVECQLAEVKTGKSPEYLISLHELQDNMKIRTEVAGILKQLKLQNITNQYEAEIQAALQNFESEKSLTCDYIYSELMETIRRLEEDRHNSEISWGEGGEWGSRSRSRSRRKAVTVSGPYIVYMLKPQDILEDWTVIRKALKRTS